MRSDTGFSSEWCFLIRLLMIKMAAESKANNSIWTEPAAGHRVPVGQTNPVVRAVKARSWFARTAQTTARTAWRAGNRGLSWLCVSVIVVLRCHHILLRGGLGDRSPPVRGV